MVGDAASSLAGSLGDAANSLGAVSRVFAAFMGGLGFRV